MDNKITEMNDIKRELNETMLGRNILEIYRDYKSPSGIRLNPKDSSDRLLHYNLDRLKRGEGILVNKDIMKYNDNSKINQGSKYIIPFRDTIILGTDVAATLGMGFPIPRIFEEYIMNADLIQITGEDSDAAKNSSYMTVNSKKVYMHDMGIDHLIFDYQIKSGVNPIMDIYLKEYKKDWECEDVHLMTIKQMCKGLILNIPILTTQMYNKFYEGNHEDFEDVMIPHYYDVIEHMWDTPNHNSAEHMEQIEKVLTKLESAGNVFDKLDRIQEFPLLVEDHISIEEYNKRDLNYILSN